MIYIDYRTNSIMLKSHVINSIILERHKEGK